MHWRLLYSWDSQPTAELPAIGRAYRQPQLSTVWRHDVGVYQAEQTLLEQPPLVLQLQLAAGHATLARHQ